MDRKSEAGQSALLAVAILALLVSFGMALAYLGNATATQARTQNAADAAALAGVGGGETTARSVAESNGAELVSFEEPEGDVLVKVRIGKHTATARASNR